MDVIAFGPQRQIGINFEARFKKPQKLVELANPACARQSTEITRRSRRTLRCLAAASEIRMSQRLQRKAAIFVAIVDANVIFESNGGSSYYNECSYCDAVTVRNSFNDVRLHDCSLPS